MSLLIAIAAGLAESIRESLPSTTDEAGPFVAGMAWMAVLQWALLIAVTWLHCAAHGSCR